MTIPNPACDWTRSRGHAGLLPANDHLVRSGGGSAAGVKAPRAYPAALPILSSIRMGSGANPAVRDSLWSPRTPHSVGDASLQSFRRRGWLPLPSNRTDDGALKPARRTPSTGEGSCGARRASDLEPGTGGLATWSLSRSDATLSHTAPAASRVRRVFRTRTTPQTRRQQRDVTNPAAGVSLGAHR